MILLLMATSIHLIWNKYSAMNSNNVIYIIKETLSIKDSISNEQFIILHQEDRK
jgi:hypothetical protein